MKTKTIKENNNPDNDLMLGFVQMGIMTEYLNEFWKFLIEDGFEVIANVYKKDIDSFNFLFEFREQLTENERKAYDSFYSHSLKLLGKNKSFMGILGLRLDIFFQKKHQGVILTGLTTQREKETLYRKSHFILIIREGEEEKINKSRIKAHQKLPLKNFKPLIKQLGIEKTLKLMKNQKIEESLNPKKFPIFKIDISKFQNQEFFNQYKRLPI